LAAKLVKNQHAVPEINARLSSVLTTLYLLFNEGYYSSNRDITLRKELCFEAMRLTYLPGYRPVEPGTDR
jgi:RNA polymerase sigma-70 factor (ECF subfamily)